MDMLKSPLARDALIVAGLVWGAWSIHSRLDRMEYQINVAACGCDRGMFGVGNIVTVKNENTNTNNNLTPLQQLAWKIRQEELHYEHMRGTVSVADRKECGCRGHAGIADGCDCRNGGCPGGAECRKLAVSGGSDATAVTEHAGRSTAD